MKLNIACNLSPSSAFLNSEMKRPVYLIYLLGHGIPQLLKAVTTLLPLDTYVPAPVRYIVLLQVKCFIGQLHSPRAVFYT